MGLFEEIQQANKTRTGTPCTVGTILNAMSKEDAKTLREALADPSIKGTAIWRALSGRGYKINEGTVTRHRRKGCTCGS